MSDITLIDYSPLIIRAVAVEAHRKGTSMDERLIRHMIFNMILGISKKFPSGNIGIVCDSGKVWRKDIFPYYKANRKKAKKESPLDWDMVFRIMDETKDDLEKYFPYLVLQVPYTEADDIIGVLSKLVYYDEVNIVSGDKDFIQLLSSKRVQLWDPGKKVFIKNKDPELYLKEHIIRGDSSDGIPNIYSDEDTFVTDGKRQKSVYKKKLQKLLEYDGFQNLLSETELARYKMNETLIDLLKIPENIKEEIIKQYKEQLEIIETKGGMKNLLDYFGKHKMRVLASHISDFQRKKKKVVLF